MAYDTTPTFHENFGEVPKGLLATLKRGKVTISDFQMMEMQGFAGRNMDAFVKEHTKGGHFNPPWPLPRVEDWKK